MYAIPEENRTISYIAVDIVPSAEDMAAAQNAINKVLGDLSSTEGLAALDGKTSSLPTVSVLQHPNT